MGFLIVAACCIGGLVAGSAFGYNATSSLGFFCGLAIGLIVVRQRALTAQLEALRGKIGRLEGAVPDQFAARVQADIGPIATASALAAAVAASAPEPPDASELRLDRLAAVKPPPSVPRAGTESEAVAPSAPGTLPLRTARNTVGSDMPRGPRPPVHPDPIQKAFATLKRWFSEGNVPVKIGMLVLFAGVAALLKYASDEGWLHVPIEIRLVGIALAAMAALAFGWRERSRRRAFALALQGGAIGVLVLTVFAAFRLYGLLPPTTAFALLLVLVAGTGVLAVLQDALALAVLGILAGFAAPILISTGDGNHVVLFSYYTLLNLAIFAIAWVRSWRALNLLGFFFTFAIGTAWGVLRYDRLLLASTEPFLMVFFAIYLAIPVLHARQREPSSRDLVDGTLVFGNPLVAFALQAALLEGERMPLAYAALALAALYVLLAWWMLPRRRVLGESFAVLGVGFATVAVPLALSARTTACTFALEGAALIWLGLRQQRMLPRITGLALQVFAAGAFVLALLFGQRAADMTPIANGPCVSALLIAAAGLISAWLHHRGRMLPKLALALYLWGLAWWLGAGTHEIDRFVTRASGQAAALLALAALTAVLAAVAGARLRARASAWTAAVALASGVVIVFLFAAADARPFAGWGLAALAAYAGCGVLSLYLMRDEAGPMPRVAQIGWIWTWTLAVSLALRQFADDAHLASGWHVAAMSLPLLAAWAIVLLRPGLISPPLTQRFAEHRGMLLASQTFIAMIAFASLLFQSGDSAPLPFVPLINPLELVQVGALLCFVRWLSDRDAPSELASQRVIALAIAGFAFVTAVTLRATHQLGGVGWEPDVLWSSNLAQTALTVVWSVLGVIGWVIGSRRSQRLLWLAGAGLMGVVLAKLVLVDRTHLGNLFGIASFIAYGLLCTVIGYFAPAPPRLRADGASA